MGSILRQKELAMLLKKPQGNVVDAKGDKKRGCDIYGVVYVAEERNGAEEGGCGKKYIPQERLAPKYQRH